MKRSTNLLILSAMAAPVAAWLAALPCADRLLARLLRRLSDGARVRRSGREHRVLERHPRDPNRELVGDALRARATASR